MKDALETPIPTFSDEILRHADLPQDFVADYLTQLSSKTNRNLSVVDFSRLRKPNESVEQVLEFFVKDEGRRNHCIQVGECAQLIGKKIKREDVDPDLLRRTGVLHDIGNYPNVEKKAPWHIWKGVIILASLGFRKEAEVLAGMSPLAEGLGFYYQETSGGDWREDFPYIHYPITTEQQILTLTDHMITPTGKIVTLEERREDIHKRYEVGNPVRDIVDMAWPNVLKSQHAVLETLNITEQQLIEELKGGVAL